MKYTRTDVCSLRSIGPLRSPPDLQELRPRAATNSRDRSSSALWKGVYSAHARIDPLPTRLLRWLPAKRKAFSQTTDLFYASSEETNAPAEVVVGIALCSPHMRRKLHRRELPPDRTGSLSTTARANRTFDELHTASTSIISVTVVGGGGGRRRQRVDTLELFWIDHTKVAD